MTTKLPPLSRDLCRALVTAGFLAFTLAACGPREIEPAAPPPTAVPAAALPTVEPGSAGDTSTFVFAHPEDAAKLDPADVTDGESLLVTVHVYEGLTRYKSGTTEVEPALATEWKATEDGLAWDFTLRQGVKFHDGTDFNADAVVWNFNRWFDKAHPQHFADWDFAYWSDMFQGYKGDVDDAGKPKSFFDSIAAVDPTTVRIKLTRPNAPLLQTLAMSNFAMSSPAAVTAAGNAYGTPDGKPVEAGTGPYTLSEWVPKDHITVQAFEGYWGEAPKSPNLIFKVIPDGTARFLAITKGEIDGMNQVNPEDIATGQADPNLKVLFEPANNVGYLGFNQAHKPWNNKDCRLAVAQAIDKQGILNTLYAGDAAVAIEMLPPSMWGYNGAITDYPFDLTLAKESLAACLKAEKLPESVVFYVPPIQRFYFPKPKELGEAIQANLAELGVNTKIESPDWKTLYLKNVREGVADIFLLGWGGDNGDPDNYLCVFFCGGDASFNADAKGEPAPPDEALNKVLREAATLSDQAARKAKYEEANQLAHDAVLSVPLVHRTPPLIFRSSVTGYVSSPIQTVLTTVSK